MKTVKITHAIACDMPGCGKLANICVKSGDAEIYNFCGVCASKLCGALSKITEGDKDAKKTGR